MFKVVPFFWGVFITTLSLRSKLEVSAACKQTTAGRMVCFRPGVQFDSVSTRSSNQSTGYHRASLDLFKPVSSVVETLG